MTGEMWAALGVCVTAVFGLIAAIRSSRTTENTTGRSASAAEVESLGRRLDTQRDQIEVLERTVRALRNYVAEDHEEHRRHGWKITPMPEEIA